MVQSMYLAESLGVWEAVLLHMGSRLVLYPTTLFVTSKSLEKTLPRTIAWSCPCLNGTIKPFVTSFAVILINFVNVCAWLKMASHHGNDVIIWQLNRSALPVDRTTKYSLLFLRISLMTISKSPQSIVDRSALSEVLWKTMQQHLTSESVPYHTVSYW